MLDPVTIRSMTPWHLDTLTPWPNVELQSARPGGKAHKVNVEVYTNPQAQAGYSGQMHGGPVATKHPNRPY